MSTSEARMAGVRPAALHAELLDAVEQAVIATDADRRIIYWNRFAENLYGWTAAEVLGRDVAEVTPAERAAAEAPLERVEHGDAWAGEFLVRRKSGEAFPAYVSVSPIKDATGAVTGAIGISFDLTAQKARDQHYEALFLAMTEGFAFCEVIRDKHGGFVDYTILEINPALQAMLGVGPEVVGSRLSAGPVNPRWQAACEQAVRTGEAVDFEYHNRATGRWHAIRLNRVGDDHLAQFFFDITERKLAELRQAQLFDELNHRVKNNLAMVSSLLQLQARGAGPAARAQLMKAVDRLASVSAVHESLYSGDRKDDVDFGAYLQALCARLADSLLEGDRVRIEVAADPEAVSIDHAAPLGMIVNELITNAAKYAYPEDRAGVIQVRFGREGDALLLAISDDGVGLPGETQRNPTGLGMRVVNALVKQVGGSLSVRRQGGARFEIRLPEAGAA